MAGALNILLTICLLHGVLSADFQIFLPETIEAVAGSCVTIPCSFEIQDKYEKYLNDTCVAIWRKGNNWSSAQDVTSRFIIKATTGDLKNKICTSTMNNIQIADGGSYFFRVQCNNALKYTFYSSVNINVKADPPKPTLSPSELEVEEGASVSLQCSAPAPCPSLRPTVTWTPSLGTSQETLMDNQDKTKVIKSVLNFTASHLHHGQRFSCTAVYRREDNRNVSSVSQRLSAHVKYRPEDTKVSVSPSGPVQEGTNVVLKCSSDANPAVQIYTWYRADPQHETLIHTGPDLTITASRNTGAFLCQAENDLGTGRSNKTNIDVQFAPQILSSSNCTKAAATVSCSCSTVGNPSPRLQWYLDGLSVTHSDKVDISSESLNGTGLRSTITVNLPQELDLSTLFCHSSNSVGSTVRQLNVNSFEQQTYSRFGQGLFPVILAVAVVSLSMNVFYTIYMISLRRKSKQNVMPSEEDTTYMSLDRRDVSPEYGVIGQLPT
ncbi:myelin-associated glycoprotein-like isoform X5 [Sphaeramia orbicularis]|uniref:myelin-associated glycoprotein-like isoform X5 n=1 Tax=Sphaeramia orbicularis TaxID=375764 RepID=UPI00118117AB|nr:myelin-associated glycoprotein-like isoform X5 [Sphaeramia orbicularis]